MQSMSKVLFLNYIGRINSDEWTMTHGLNNHATQLLGMTNSNMTDGECTSALVDCLKKAWENPNVWGGDLIELIMTIWPHCQESVKICFGLSCDEIMNRFKA